MAVKSELNTTTKRRAAQAVKFCVKQERNVMLKKVYALLKKTEIDRSEEEKQFLFTYIDLVKEVRRRIERQNTLKERLKEIEDPPDVIGEKCIILAEALAACRRLVVYTGAGVSTAACIPDYRGSNGIWTLLQQGKDIGLHDLSKAEPTLTHMALTQLYHVGLIKHVVSQNCDGLHLRSGLPREALSEVHGNMYIEVCRHCQPVREYLRLFDVTENTGRFNHRTGRRCYMCSGSLVDSIVHFGERGTLKWPLNWPGAVAAAASADAILCIGSSLKVLKRYPWLWGMDKHPKKRPKLYIVNLQWTPKDDHAVLKINARCDFVMEKVMHHLQINVPSYNRSVDPIFAHATPLHPTETHTTTKPFLTVPETKLTNSHSQISQEILSVKSGKCDKLSFESLEVEGTCGTNKCENLSEKQFKNEEISYNSVQEESLFSSTVRISESLIGLKDESFSVNFYNESHVNRPNFVKNTCLSDDSSAMGNVVHTLIETKINSGSFEEAQTKEEHFTESISSDEPFMDIIYEGVKLKVEDNLSVEANVKINNDMLILCDTPSIHCNSFIFNSSYELEESDNDFKFEKMNTSDLHDSKLDGYKSIDNNDINNANNNSLNNEIVSLSNKKMLLFLSPNEHNFSQITANPARSSSSHVNVVRSPVNDVQMPNKCSSASDLCKRSSHECVCCAAWYGANECLFYIPVEPVFRNTSEEVCEETEEEDELEDIEKKEDKDGNSSSVKSNAVTNPGWYGKGYRKRIKKKR